MLLVSIFNYIFNRFSCKTNSKATWVRLEWYLLYINKLNLLHYLTCGAARADQPWLISQLLLCPVKTKLFSFFKNLILNRPLRRKQELIRIICLLHRTSLPMCCAELYHSGTFGWGRYGGGGGGGGVGDGGVGGAVCRRWRKRSQLSAASAQTYHLW